MPFQTRIQPIDFSLEPIRNESGRSASKFRLKRLLDRQFASVLRSSEKNEALNSKESEPSSVCLDNLVQNFIEDNNEKSSATKSSRTRCNCFNRSSYSSEEEMNFLDFGDNLPNSTLADVCEMLKSITPCASVSERNVLADTAKIVDKHKNLKRKDELRSMIIGGLRDLSYNVSICKSHWERSPSYPAGEHEFIDVILDGERMLIDVDFRGEFEIARPTSTYRSILQSLPFIFVGKPDRLQKILLVLSEAAKQSLKKKGMPVPPWRTAEYMRAKWLSPSSRPTEETIQNDSGTPPVSNPWQPPPVVKSCERGGKIVVTGLASLLEAKP